MIWRNLYLCGCVKEKSTSLPPSRSYQSIAFAAAPPLRPLVGGQGDPCFAPAVSLFAPASPLACAPAVLLVAAMSQGRSRPRRPPVDDQRRGRWGDCGRADAHRYRPELAGGALRHAGAVVRALTRLLAARLPTPAGQIKMPRHHLAGGGCVGTGSARPARPGRCGGSRSRLPIGSASLLGLLAGGSWTCSLGAVVGGWRRTGRCAEGRW